MLNEYRAVLKKAGLDLQLAPIKKWDFYDAVNTADHVLTVQTGDMQRFANLLLSIECGWSSGVAEARRRAAR